MNNKTFYFSVAVSFIVGAAISSFTLASVADKPAPNTSIVEQAFTNLVLQQKEAESRLMDIQKQQKETESRLVDTQKRVQLLLDNDVPCDCDDTEYNPYPTDPEKGGW